MTMWEAMALSKRLKEENLLQDKFVAEVGLPSWDEAAKVLPEFISILEMYRGLDKDKQIAFKVIKRNSILLLYLGFNLWKLCNEARLYKRLLPVLEEAASLKLNDSVVSDLT